MKIRTALMTRRRLGRLTMIGTLVVVPLVAACESGARAGPQGGVTVSDLQQKQYFYQGEYLGRMVTVSATVSDVLAPRVFELSEGDVRHPKLLVVTDQPVDISEGQAVRVTGIVGQAHTWDPSERVPYIQEDLYTRYETKAYLYHATVERLQAAEQGTGGSVS
jgi:hypothetical protein